MATPQASSRLELLQARFQQKQLQEKEQKLLQLYDQQQQRAYQVVQRGSAGSNSSNHGSSISQHTVTKTTTTSHTTSTSQGGKVRQMFDERRQTTVKGIDRSYPLEPLENKPRKQTNGNVVQKNGNLTVNRQSVTVKRVARADVNSNLNGGKPIVSYHEEITRESYSPGRQQPDDDEFGNENHNTQYANGNQTHIEEVLDEDTIERNRMMAKLHLMEYDETLKHRVKNDLESEEFPEDYMMDVPDKLPKRTVTKKLSQAEARLERFKNANAKRSNSITKNPGTVLKKRSDPILPAKSTSSEDEGKTRVREILDRGSSSGNPRKIESNVIGNVEDVSLRNESLRTFCTESEKLMGLKVDEELEDRTRRNGSPKFFCEESGRSATTYAINTKNTEKLSPGFSKYVPRRSESPKLFDSKNARKSSVQLSKDGTKRSDSPKFFCKESERSATTYAMDSKTKEKLSPEFSENTQRRSESPEFPDSITKRKSSDQLSKNRIKQRSESQKFFCRESEKLATTYAIDSKTGEKLSPHASKNIKKRSESPKFFCKESEKSATTYAIDSKTKQKLSPEFSKNIQRRNESPEFLDSKASRKSSNQVSKDRIKRSDSPKFFCKESEKSATTYSIDSKTKQKLSPEFSKDIKKRSNSPKFYCKESEKSATTFAIDSKSAKELSSKFSVKDTRRNESSKYFCRESEKSATTYAIDSRSRSTSPDFVKVEPRHVENIPVKSNFDTINKSKSVDIVDRKERMNRSSSPRNYQKTETEMDSKSTRNKMPNVFERLTRERCSSPKFVRTSANTKVNILEKRNEDSGIIRATKSKSPNLTKKLGRSSTSPQFYTSDSETSATIMLVTPETILKTKPESSKSEETKQDSESYRSNAIVGEPKRRMSEEIVDASSKQNIRSSVSRFFSEQCEKAARNLQENVQSAQTDRNLHWSRDSSPLSLKDMRAPSPKSPRFSRMQTEKSISTTAIDGSRDWSLKSRRNSRSVSPQLLENKIFASVKRSESRSRHEIARRSKPKSPDGFKASLRSIRLIRDAMKRQNDQTRGESSGRCDPRGSKRNSRVSSDAAGAREASDEEADEPPGSESSPKSSTSVEVDAEIQEITMPDQYIEHRPRQADKTRGCGRSSTERLFTYSARRPGSRRGSLFELSKRDQGKTDRREASGRKERVERNAKSSPSPANSLALRGSKLRVQENGKTGQKIEIEGLRKKRILDECDNEKHDNLKSRNSSPANNLIVCDSKRQIGENRKVNQKTGVEALRSQEERILDKHDKEKYGNLKCIKGNMSRSPSPANNLIFRGSKRRTEENDKVNREIEIEGSRSREGTLNSIRSKVKLRLLDEYNKETNDDLKHTMRNTSNSPSPTINLTTRGSKRVSKEDNKIKNLQKTILNESNKEAHSKHTRKTSNDSTVSDSKRRITETVNRRNETRVSREKTPSPIQTKQKKASSRSPQILRSMKLVQRAIKGKSFEQEEKSQKMISETAIPKTQVNKSDSIGRRKSSSTIVYINDESSSSKNYERTDSVESALKRFDSIGAESIQSAAEKRQPLEESKAISLEVLDPSRASLGETSVILSKMNKNQSKTQGIRCQKKFARARDSVEIVRITIGSKSPVCKRKLFQDADSGDEIETGSSKSRYSLNSTTIAGRSLEKSDSKRSDFSQETLNGKSQLEDEEIDEMSTDTSLSVSVIQLRSIEDIRKSIDTRFDTKGTSTKSAIANDALKRSNGTRSRRTNLDDRAGGRKEISENLAAKNHALRDAERSSIKCAMRFFRVTKSPSPDPTKTTETGNRARRNVLSSPSNSPDTGARRPSTELKVQEARSSKRLTLMKGTEPIGNRKSMTTTSTRKSTDVVDGAILENGVHLRDQTAETKYDNDPPATKKSDAFVIDFDEQPPKENDAPIPRKSLLRKQSIDKQTPSTQTGRPPSSISSTSSGNSMQGQISGFKGRMASKTKTPTSGSTQKGSAGSKSGGCTSVVDTLTPCKICGRRFAQDRVAFHEQICTKTTQKKRKQFDAMMYRVKGTDLEPFVKRGLCKKQPEKSKKPEPKSNWRRKHEDFINAIRSAKQVQAHLAAGGKLSDLPPPPPSDTCDYIQCPHCGRKFNQPAAERHIPKCKTMLHNKPIHSRAPKPKR